ncbi:membrane protein [Streptococcus pneumoniae]|nr:membrane protein [Streptococcus pneumoniae]VNL03150.1 membrane protein [Streptococcus pneumoniae]
MKKETFTEKLIKCIYGISGPLDEHKRREADRIGNQVFIILFYLIIFGNLIPLLLAYKYPQEVALIYPPLILVIALIAAGYVTQMKKTGITVIEPDMLNEKESKQLHYPGLKAGLFFGLWIFFITPLLSILIDEGQDYFHSLLTIRNGVSSILGSIFFGASIQFLIYRRIAKTKKNQDEGGNS